MIQEFWMCLTENTKNVSCHSELLDILNKRFGSEKTKERLIEIAQEKGIDVFQQKINEENSDFIYEKLKRSNLIKIK